MCIHVPGCAVFMFISSVDRRVAIPAISIHHYSISHICTKRNPESHLAVNDSEAHITMKRTRLSPVVLSHNKTESLPSGEHAVALSASVRDSADAPRKLAAGASTEDTDSIATHSRKEVAVESQILNLAWLW